MLPHAAELATILLGLLHPFGPGTVPPSAAGGEVDALPAPPEPTQRPPRDMLRQNEDWSVLRGVDLSATGDFWDRIKYIELDARGRRWLSIGGHVALRSESWEDFNFERPPGQSYDDSFLLSRVLLHADIHLGEALRVYVEGKTAQTTDRDLPGGTRTLDADHLDLQQGFVDWEFAAGGSTTTLRAGRQMLRLGDQRLVSPLLWSNTMRTWEGLTAATVAGDWKVTALFTRFVPVDIDDFNRGDDDHLLYGLYGTRARGPGGTDLYWLGVANRDAAFNGTSGDEFRQTLGTRWWGALGTGGAKYDLEAAGQFGRVGDEDVLAWMLASRASVPLTGPDGSLRGRIGLDWASGDAAAGGDVGTFNPLYQWGHAYYGYMDEIGRQNAIDAWIGLEWRPAEPWEFSADWHVFWLSDADDALYNPGGSVVVPGGSTAATEIGNEIDLLASWRIDAHATAYLGYSHFFAGEVIADTGPDSDIDFAYVGFQYYF